MADWDNRNQHETPIRAEVRGAIEFLEAKKILYFKQDVFDHFAVSHRQGWAMISKASEDRRHHRAEGVEHCGRPRLISNRHPKEIDRIIKEDGFEARALSWHDLAYEKKWCNKKLVKDRKAWVELMKDRYPEPSDWYRVRFSDKTEEKDDREKVLKRVHAWAAIGHNFKSDLTFYEIKSNTNGKMTQRACIDQMVEPVVKPWLERGDDFVLEEDDDSGHGPGKSNIVRKSKQDNKLEHYFNCHSSPDFALIENCWQPPKQYIKKFPC
ncbi:hypothetical protein EK21DRAFT_95113 [Setomelanomma holmii]|uniref:Uncharacterized protein n=1 Tax=Setomelanomma holmii TaxID=210430 RepID=A0A9P4GXE6_9PLEO|nr:hypothetical protein EK21DRAFT_95113 [Setomelanomma holmii]